jgi:hypothetical protein
MIGSSIVTLPWAYSQAGLLTGILIQTISFAFSYFTNYMLLKSAGSDIDFTDTLKKHFGKFSPSSHPLLIGKTGWTAGMIIFILTFYVPIIIWF